MAGDFGGTGNWGESDQLVASDAEADDLLGFDLSLQGPDLAAGARLDDPGGSVYLFAPEPGAPLLLATGLAALVGFRRLRTE